MKRTIRQRTLAVLITASLILSIPPTVLGRRQGGTTRYVYDDNGRLHAVISPNGEAAVYEYDPAGNITAVRRLAADTLAVFAFSPREGVFGDPVTFVGSGFGGGVTGVSFNGTAAQVVETTPSSLVALVPEGATTGPVTITTPAASVTTSTPFTVRGLRVSPAAARVLFNETIQFTAEVVTSGEDALTWSVNGVVGGDVAVGTITPEGLYTAPRLAGTVTVRASLAASPDIFGEALVTVRDPAMTTELLAPLVSVRRGLPRGTAVAASSVGVHVGHSSGIRNVSGAATSVHYGFGQTEPRAPSLSVGYGSASGQTAAADSVSLTRGPHIVSVSPAQVSRGATLTLTVTGANLSGVDAIRFLNASSGALDTTLTVTDLSVNAEGTVLTAMLAVGATAALGNRVVIVTTPAASSVTANVGSNLLRIVN
ncbi:MAG TPA: RHS repeat domain-containing protein [Pyrinomonadaceae bacterium]|nr:RHS repeat domain-containing protein [Pyrinomonadaceae bacterium]